MEGTQIDLYEFLIESELQHYYNAIKNELKITNAAQFKYASDEDLKHIGLSRPEIRRLRKFYDKHFPHGYLSKIKRLLQAPTTIVKREDGTSTLSLNTSTEMASSTRSLNSPCKVPSNKHIIPVDAISVNKQLGTGEFGIVQQGVWTNGAERIQVAIKCLCRERMQSNPMEFLKEAAIMHSIEHENIVRLHGVVLATDSLMLVTELAHLRSLLECLKDAGLRTSFLTIPTLCEFAMQICNGMKYLENKRLIHRDLAARNILVFSKNKVKISDFGLSRALGVGKDYYKTNFNVNLKLPIAWCAPECINYLRFTNASDVWAYGVCLWEMFSYGFQPWAALMGLQILEAIDAPNYQRLEQPDCCPREYYTLMLKCWQDDPAKRPKFGEIYEILPDIKPEQLKAIVNNTEPKKDHLLYRQGEIITVLDRCTANNLWKGVLSSGKTGFFNPSNTVAYLEGLPSSNRDSFCRVSERSSKRKLKTEMISKPQNDFKHTGHVGIDGVSFGDVAFLGSSQSYNHVPRQIVTPYKPSEDIEQTPLLLPPTPTSPDSLQTASGYFADCINPTSINPSFIPSTENTPKNLSNMGQSSFEFPEDQSQMAHLNNSTNPFVNKSGEGKYNNYGQDDQRIIHAESDVGSVKQTRPPVDGRWRSFSRSSTEDPHEYHEISDDEITADKLDFGPSLLDEINSLFGSMNAETFGQQKPNEAETATGKSDFAEMGAKMTRKNSSGDANGNKFGVSLTKKKTAGTVKQISVKDERILNQAIEIANEISARSMIDLVSDQSAPVQSPKRKFSFRFPHLSNNTASEKAHHFGSPTMAAGTRDSLPFKSASPSTKKKNFTEELKNIPDIQAIIGEEGREAYNNLIERKTSTDHSPATDLLRYLDEGGFELATSKTLPRRSIAESSIENQQLGSTQLEQTSHALRPMTLPTRGRVKIHQQHTPQKTVLCEKHTNDINIDHSKAVESNSPLGSPSYITNTFQKFSEPTKESTANKVPNPIPLPSREGKKHIKTNAKRHVRKYPLIIPANGVQRTLNKVADITNGGMNQIKLEVVSSLQAQNRNISKPLKDKQLAVSTGDPHIYQNIDKVCPDTNTTDTASLKFESILEANFNESNVLQSPDVTDGFYNFSIQKEQYNKDKEVDFDAKNISGLYVNEDELRNLDIEKNINVTKTTKERSTNDEVATGKEKVLTYSKAENELAGNALFKKVRESINTAMTATESGQKEPAQTQTQTEGEYFAEVAARLKDSNSVSCEDLLEFSDKKPKGCERGVDSDEVRIMMKVLGKDSTPTRCLHTLEFIAWDVHKAIKMIKLQNIFPALDYDLSRFVEVLQECDWDLHHTTLKLKGLKY